MTDDVLQIPLKKDVLGIIKEGADRYVRRMDNAIHPGFLARINVHLRDELLCKIPAKLLKDLTQVSSGSANAKHLPQNMLNAISHMRGIYLDETAYYTAQAFVFFRLQEHQSAYAMFKMAIIAEKVSAYTPQSMDTVYQEMENNENIRHLVLNAQMHAETYIARTCQMVHKHFEWKPK
jgi:hypothetical protein